VAWGSTAHTFHCDGLDYEPEEKEKKDGMESIVGIRGREEGRE
jgi:hypothetical protein